MDTKELSSQVLANYRWRESNVDKWKELNRKNVAKYREKNENYYEKTKLYVKNYYERNKENILAKRKAAYALKKQCV